MVRPIPFATAVLCFVAAVVFVLGRSSSVEAAIVFNEAFDGDFSNDNNNPTAIGPLAVGTSTVLGTTDTGAPDIFSVEVVAGTFLTGLFIEHYENLTRPLDRNMFLAVDDSSTFPDDYFFINSGFFSDTSSWLAGSVVGANEVASGANVLNRLAVSNTTTFIGTGFTAPLGAGTYTFYIQQTGGMNDYTLSFVTAVPEPTTSVALLGGLLVVGLRRYRKNCKKALAPTAAA